MAENIAGAGAPKKPTSQNVSATHNVEHRTEVIRKALEEDYKLTKEIERLTAQHIAPLREARSKITKRLREDFSMPAKTFRLRSSLYRVEKNAIDADDDIMLDTLREMFEIAPAGTQLDFISAGAEKPETPKATTKKAAAKKPGRKPKA